MRRSFLPVAALLAGVSIGAVALGVATLARDPDYFSAAGRVAITTTHEEVTAKALAELVSGTSARPIAQTVKSDDLRPVYEARDHRLIWTGSPMALAQAAEVIEILRHAGDDALNPNDYRVADLAKRQPNSLYEAAEYDVLLSDAVMRYARDLRFGRAAAKASDWDIDVPSEAFDLTKAFVEAASAGRMAAMLQDMQPLQPEYHTLKSAFLRYRAAAQAGGWPDVSARTGMRDLRARLAIEDPGLSSEAKDGNGDVVAALKRYQARNGLRADGRLNAETVRMLNVSASQRAAQVAANMERWRWLPPKLEPTRIVVNVTDQRLTAFRDGEAVLSSVVVVGDQDTRTPILRAFAGAVTVNPPWNVPASIVKNEILPRLKANPNYLARQRMRVTGTSGGLMRVQQSPGAYNALGRVKFEMPNKFNVYLHDTPTKAAFARDDRTLSHGCIRVQQILPLGSVALSGNGQAAIARINGIIATNKTRTLKLDEPMPVYIAYWTAIPDESGAVAFKPDVYGRDKRMIAKLGGFNWSALSADGPS